MPLQTLQLMIKIVPSFVLLPYSVWQSINIIQCGSLHLVHVVCREQNTSLLETVRERGGVLFIDKYQNMYLKIEKTQQLCC